MTITHGSGGTDAGAALVVMSNGRAYSKSGFGGMLERSTCGNGLKSMADRSYPMTWSRDSLARLERTGPPQPAERQRSGMRVLLAEDSVSLQKSVSQGLREHGYAVDVVGDGRQAVIHGQTTQYDVIVLDLMLPELDGMSVLRRLRDKRIAAGILILTAMDAVEDRVRGLAGGADDYLVKPFAFAELLARIQALARRVHGVRDASIRVGVLVIDPVRKVASIVSKPPRALDLTPREFALLEYLAHRAGKPVSRAELEEHLYDDRSQVMSNAIDVAISAIRSKLQQAGCPPLIHTRRKVGYVLWENPR
jgi:DNA-binding response OmpR family regulator